MNKRQEISRKVLEAIEQRRESAPALPTPEEFQPRTYMGRVGAQLTRGYAARVQELEAERVSGGVVVSLDPKRIRHSSQVSRSSRSLTADDPRLLRLKGMIERDGQLQPIAVREIQGDPDHEYELVFGHRRHAVSLLLDAEREDGFKVRAIIDAEAADEAILGLHMHQENEREDPSAYEVGKGLEYMIAHGYAKDATELAEKLDVARANVYRYLFLADLPQEILDAFGDERAISLRWADGLRAALTTDHDAVIEAAKKLAGRTALPDAETVRRTLEAAASKSPPRRKTSQTETFKIGGRPAFSYTFDRGKSGKTGQVTKSGQFKIRFGTMVSPADAEALAAKAQEFLRGELLAKYGSGDEE